MANVDDMKLPPSEATLPLHRDHDDLAGPQYHKRSRKHPVFTALLAVTLVCVLWGRISWNDRNSDSEAQLKANSACGAPACQRNPAYLVKAKHGAVASENEICSNMGVNVMKTGGNAVDAAISTTLCVGVLNMFSCVYSMSRITAFMNIQQVRHWWRRLHDRPLAGVHDEYNILRSIHYRLPGSGAVGSTREDVCGATRRSALGRLVRGSPRRAAWPPESTRALGHCSMERPRRSRRRTSQGVDSAEGTREEDRSTFYSVCMPTIY